MRSNKTQEEVINEFRRVHGDFYNYDKVVYIGTNKKVIIVCPIHGDFPQTPNGHKRGFDNSNKKLWQSYTNLYFGTVIAIQCIDFNNYDFNKRSK